MKKILIPITLAATMGAGHVFAGACAEPADVELPDGATATTDDMVAGQKAVKTYIADGEAFLACMEQEEKSQVEELTDEQKKANVERYNAVVDKMQLLAQGFNDQIKAYKAAQAEN